MESGARRGIRLARARSRMGSLKQNSQLVAGQHSVPLHALQAARTVAAIVFDELGGQGKSVRGWCQRPREIARREPRATWRPASPGQ